MKFNKKKVSFDKNEKVSFLKVKICDREKLLAILLFDLMEK